MTTPNRLTSPCRPAPIPENSDYWDTSGAVTYRLIWSRPMPLPDELARENVRAVVVQYRDGALGTEGDDQPLIYIGGSDYTLTNARALAQAIIEAADQADDWTAAQDIAACTLCDDPGRIRRGSTPDGVATYRASLCQHVNEVEVVRRSAAQPSHAPHGAYTATTLTRRCAETKTVGAPIIRSSSGSTSMPRPRT